MLPMKRLKVAANVIKTTDSNKSVQPFFLYQAALTPFLHPPIHLDTQLKISVVFLHRFSGRNELPITSLSL